MFGKLFILFAILPIAEIALLINVGEQIGGWNTVAIVVVTAFIGAYFVRQQGIATLMQAQSKMQSGAMPGQEMAEGLLLVVAGILLVTPGFITDALGFLLALPITRPFIAKSLLKQISVNVVAGQPGQGQHSYSHTSYTQTSYSNRGNQADGDIIEGEYVDKDEAENRPKIDSPSDR
ncbi:FxsA family protein [Aliiglaciecola sp. 2_MG-2023]|uniref:FxsA family protein n=1 Tax=Alteromonadaceae TaxID=72275 RepID=UPI0026E38E46|nr:MULTISPECIES: FxsA family protein [unclassified Aliiglaciecola]MDO6711163.1 FxsA family protein [Aliiglaciecola sp. 2_MG-2023]MDO6752077.1 FxsA family protein [Aliiglaciecola sp. 1_MG-2023]